MTPDQIIGWIGVAILSGLAVGVWVGLICLCKSLYDDFFK